ncbi:MAG TPA: PaaI family thioesterase [Polyangiales bacterium]|nr:PaaI family thioesterase [Polyangiales bacterium]
MQPDSSIETPQGFVRHDRKSAVTDPWEPIWVRPVDQAVQLAVRISPAHCNARGFLHGGVIASLADNAMGLTLARSTGSSAVTVSLTVDYVRSAGPGQWLQIEPRVIRAAGKLGFVDALVTADGETIARANATFRVVEARAAGAAGAAGTGA